MLPHTGAVLGIDVGWSEKRATSAVCRLDWDVGSITWDPPIRFRALETERVQSIRHCGADRQLLAIAIDGPLKRNFPIIGRYRIAEKMLTCKLATFIGKPGQANVPNGKKLNEHANLCATTVVSTCGVAASRSDIAVHSQAIAEAFPTTFLGLMLDNPRSISTTRGKRSDTLKSWLPMASLKS